VKQLGSWAARLGWKRIFIVTDPAIVKAGITARVEETLRAANMEYSIYSGGVPEPSFAVVGAAASAAKTFQPDAILGLGGGSNLDLAKITAVVHTHGGTGREYVGEDKVPGLVLPIICIPTTAGTGSEVSCSCVLTDEEQQIKVSPLSWWLRPRLSIVDPELTVTCPPQVTADSGIDALVHAIEAFCTIENEDFPVADGEVSIYQGRNPISNEYARTAIRLIGKNLRTAYHEPTNLEARTGMATAATLAGLAFANSGLALVHALEYPLAGIVHVTHGAGNGLFLPHVLRFNLPMRKKELAEIAALLAGEEFRAAHYSQNEIRSKAEQGIALIEKMLVEFNIPTRLRDLGVKKEQLNVLAEKTMGITRLLRLNPRPVTHEDVLEVLNGAW
jgi:alcohol dehydrogenase class IV